VPLRAPHQILVAVEPAVLGDVIVELLVQSGVGDVITVAKNARDTVPGSRFDAAVVTGVLPADVTVGVTIALPDEEGGAGVGVLLEGGRSGSIVISTPLDVLATFDAHCPAATRRAAGLTDALRQRASQLLTRPDAEEEA
jgi:hypothetical protein